MQHEKRVKMPCHRFPPKPPRSRAAARSLGAIDILLLAWELGIGWRPMAADDFAPWTGGDDDTTPRDFSVCIMTKPMDDFPVSDVTVLHHWAIRFQHGTRDFVHELHADGDGAIIEHKWWNVATDPAELAKYTHLFPLPGRLRMSAKRVHDLLHDEHPLNGEVYFREARNCQTWVRDALALLGLGQLPLELTPASRVGWVVGLSLAARVFVVVKGKKGL